MKATVTITAELEIDQEDLTDCSSAEEAQASIKDSVESDLDLGHTLSSAPKIEVKVEDWREKTEESAEDEDDED